MSSQTTPQPLVNPIAVRNCVAIGAEFMAPVLDISFMRVVIEETEPHPGLVQDELITLDFALDRHRFLATVCLQARGPGWARLAFDRIVPSAHAHLRSFLNPKKVGESILEDGRMGDLRHYHGLNESELWFDPQKGILFTHLDPLDPSAQFILRVLDKENTVKAGKISREDYMAMESLDAPLSLLPISDRDTYAKLGECRDIVTNFRPVGQMEYGLKQRLLKLISEHLYSAGKRFEYAVPRPRITSASPEA